MNNNENENEKFDDSFFSKIDTVFDSAQERNVMKRLICC